MEIKVWSFLIDAFDGASTLFDRVVNGVPGAKVAIVWAVFVSLAMSLIITPMRGIGSSDRALAGQVLSGRAESTKKVQRKRAITNDTMVSKQAYWRNRSGR